MTEEQIEAMKQNEKPLALCPDWMQEQFREANAEDLITFCTKGWRNVHIGEFLTDFVTYRLRADYQAPKEEPQFEEVEIPTEYINGQLFAGGSSLADWKVDHDDKWWDIVAYVYETEAQGRVVSIFPRLVLKEGFTVLNYDEDSIILDPVAVICRRKMEEE